MASAIAWRTRTSFSGGCAQSRSRLFCTSEGQVLIVIPGLPFSDAMSSGREISVMPTRPFCNATSRLALFGRNRNVT